MNVQPVIFTLEYNWLLFSSVWCQRAEIGRIWPLVTAGAWGNGERVGVLGNLLWWVQLVVWIHESFLWCTDSVESRAFPFVFCVSLCCIPSTLTFCWDGHLDWILWNPWLNLRIKDTLCSAGFTPLQGYLTSCCSHCGACAPHVSEVHIRRYTSKHWNFLKWNLWDYH
jgi:hypothetical protein